MSCISICADNAESIPERIAAKCNGWSALNVEFLLTLCASTEYPDQDSIKVIDMEIDVDRCPVTLVATNVI